MKKIIEIQGMNCLKCQERIENALNNVDGVKSVKTDLKKKIAVVDGSANDEELTKTIVQAGYKVISIKEKKGLFS